MKFDGFPITIGNASRNYTHSLNEEFPRGTKWLSLLGHFKKDPVRASGRGRSMAQLRFFFGTRRLEQEGQPQKLWPSQPQGQDQDDAAGGCPIDFNIIQIAPWVLHPWGPPLQTETLPWFGGSNVNLSRLAANIGFSRPACVSFRPAYPFSFLKPPFHPRCFPTPPPLPER